MALALVGRGGEGLGRSLRLSRHIQMLSRIRDSWTYWRLMMTLARRLGEGEPEPIADTTARLLAIRPDDFLVLLAAARAHTNLGRDHEARQLYLRALEVESDEFFALQEAGNSFFAAGDNERACPLMKRALANAPEPNQPLDPLDLRVTKILGWLTGRRNAVAARQRRHQADAQRLDEWLDWATRYVEWCESVLGPSEETVN